MMALSTGIGVSAGMYTVGALGLEGYSAGLVFGATSGFTRGFLTASSFTWYKGGSFEDGLRNGAKLGLHEGLSDAVTYSSVFAGTDMKFWQFVVNNNIRDNLDMFDGDGLQLHLGPLGWDHDDKNEKYKGFYTMFDKDINGSRRADMIMETIWGVSLIPDGPAKIPYGNKHKTAKHWFNGCKLGGNTIAGCTPQNLKLFKFYQYHDELTIVKNFLFPFWFEFYGN
jgi:hypothetical protein